MSQNELHKTPRKIEDRPTPTASSHRSGWCLARYPGRPEPKHYCTIEKREWDADKEHFVVFPWTAGSGQKKPIYFKPSKAEMMADLEKACLPYELHMPKASTRPEDYLAHFDIYQKAFASQGIQKAILSRIKMVEKPTAFNPVDMFDRLCAVYPEAFVYLLSHPSCGLWMGASPELLLKKMGAKWQTVSLAGTKPRKEIPGAWTKKELEEQEMVSHHIRTAILHAGGTNIAENGPKTVSSGAVSHLKTVFDFDLLTGIDETKVLLSALHPTPAVAGLPVNQAVALIDSTETHQRGLYTGYIGEIGKTGTTELYVNLRCMQIGASRIALYLGGGITAASNPEAEWEETELKALTLQQELHERV